MNMTRKCLLHLAQLLLILFGISCSGADDEVSSLVGVWGGTRHFGPAVYGQLEITRSQDAWWGAIGPYRLRVEANLASLVFDLPDQQGHFQGHFNQNTNSIEGYWKQPPTVNEGVVMSPVTLHDRGPHRWLGDVEPLPDEWTIYLVISRKPDGSLAAFIRNPDRNIGVFWPLDRLDVDAGRLIFRCKPLCQGTEKFEGTYYPEERRIAIYFPNRGGTYDLTPVTSDLIPGFFARGKNPPTYEYVSPGSEDDGWKIAIPQEVGMRTEPIAELVRLIEAPPTSVHDPDIHALLIARHGKLVFEEYFHGYHRFKPHNTRSATKGITSVLVGAVIQSKANLDTSTRVYDLLLKNEGLNDLDPRKREMTVEHLLTMSSGYDCNDWADPPRPGSEDMLEDKADGDYYRYTLQLPMDSKPGTSPAYCSVNANLLGDVLTAATQKPVADLFHDLLAEPLGIRHYYMAVQPTGEAYLGGGIQFLPRDFLKFGQLMLAGGIWNGKRILSKQYVEAASLPRVRLRDQTAGMRFGYLWWTTEYTFKGRSLRAYFASGNGGQEVFVIPDLDMVVASYGGNYSDSAGWSMVREYIPRFILRAIVEDGD
jgi:CubicO group peptidase (beta-lactamase class C family)